MKHYSQNQEDIAIQNYFQGYTGKLLSIGENDGDEKCEKHVMVVTLKG